MPVTESVNHQDIDRTSHASEVRPGRREHVPGIHVHETGQEVNTVRRNQSDQDDTGSRRAEEGLNKFGNTLVQREIFCATCEGVLDKVE